MGEFEIIDRRDYAGRFWQVSLWVTTVRMPDGRVLTVHDPAEPEDYHTCGQRELCAEARAAYEESLPLSTTE